MKEIDNETLAAITRHLNDVKKDVFANLILDGTPFEKSAGKYTLSRIDLQLEKAQMEFEAYSVSRGGA